MTRLLRERKAMESGKKYKRDLDLEEMVEDLQDKVRQLEKDNSHLREKMLVAKQQVITQTRRPNLYSHIPPKVNSAMPRSMHQSISTGNLRGKNMQNYYQKLTSTPIPPYAMNLLEEAKNELSNLKFLISSQKSELEQYENENEILKQKLRMQEIEFEDELNLLKSQLTQHQRQHVQENLDLIRLHRELKMKDTKVLGLQSLCNELEQKLHSSTTMHSELLKEMEEITSRLQVEQKRSTKLLEDLHQAQTSLASVPQLQDKISMLQNENTLLRETNEKFVNKALSIDSIREPPPAPPPSVGAEEILKGRISSLETSLEKEIKEKTTLEHQLAQEKELRESKESTCHELKTELEVVKSEMAGTKSLVAVLKSTAVESSELEEALTLLKMKKEQKLVLVPEGDQVTAPASAVSPSVPLEDFEKLKSSLEKYEKDYLRATEELSRLENELSTQVELAKSWEEKFTSVQQELQVKDQEVEGKLQEYVHLLDLRSNQVQKLEKYLNDIVYGTLPATINPSEGSSSQTVELSRGENLFEIHIKQVKLSQSAAEFFRCQNPSLFLSWNFYEFELQATPVVASQQLKFNFTVQYPVQVDDYFLHYLQERKVRVDLHESLGVSFRTVAAGFIDCSQLLIEDRAGQIHASTKLTGVSEMSNLCFGTMDYSLDLQITLSESSRYFKERVKALRYMQLSQRQNTIALQLLDRPSDSPHANELHIKLIRGVDLQSRNQDLQPSTFCIYKFYDLPEQDTPIVTSSNHPEFSQHHVFPIVVDPSLHRYLTSQALEVYVFDDNDLDFESYLGKAVVPLHSLSLGQPIKGVFDLQKTDGGSSGSLEIIVYWQYDYVVPNAEESPNMDEDDLITSTPKPPAERSPVRSPDVPPVPPVPKPRKSIPSEFIQKIVISSTSSEQESDESASSDSSPKHAKQDCTSTTLVPKVLPLPTEPKEQILNKGSVAASNVASPKKSMPSARRKNEGLMSNLERVSESDESSIEKSAFSDESEESEPESEENAAQTKRTFSNGAQFPDDCSMKIVVHSLRLHPSASVLHDENVRMLYVEYRFLDLPLEELETPFSLPKMAPPRSILYDFEKVFEFDSEEAERWRLLHEMIYSKSPESSYLRFTVVSEPPSDEDLDCEEVGTGHLDLREILSKQKDIVSGEVQIIDPNDQSEVGTLKVTVQALDVLVKLKEIQF